MVITDYILSLAANAARCSSLRGQSGGSADAVSKGLDIAIGLDGTGLDDDQDLWREMRLMRLLHGGRRMETALPSSAVFNSAIDTGRMVTGFSAETDLTLIDFDAMCADLLFDDLELTEILLTRMCAKYTTGLVVAGDWVLRDGRLVTVDFDGARRELQDQARADLPRLRSERKTAGLLSRAIRDHYRLME